MSDIDSCVKTLREISTKIKNLKRDAADQFELIELIDEYQYELHGAIDDIEEAVSDDCEKREERIMTPFEEGVKARAEGKKKSKCKEE